MEKLEEIKKKSEYCLHCKVKPCQKGCPLGNDIPGFIEKIKLGEYEAAYDILQETTILPAICGEICPHVKECQGKCVRGIKGEPVQIGALEAFVGEYANENKLTIKPKEGEKPEKIAVIGSGPAGLTCATYLRQYGYKVSIYEKEEKPGGALSYGVPEFRLKRETIEGTIERIQKLGVEIKTGIEVGKDITLEELKNNYDAVFFSIGSNIPKKIRIEGEDLPNVLGANELLQKSNYPDFSNKNVVVIGGRKCCDGCCKNNKKIRSKQSYHSI